MKFLKKTLLPLFLLTSIIGYTNAAWSDYIPFKWFAKKGKEKITQELLEAILNDADVTEIEKLIDQGADVNFQDQSGIAQVLCLAIAKNNYAVVELLIARGANVNLKDYFVGITPIFAALQNPHILKLLLEKGANPNVQIISGQTPLIIAIAENQIEIVKILLANGADKTIADLDGKTAVDYAKEQNLDEIIVLLENN